MFSERCIVPTCDVKNWVGQQANRREDNRWFSNVQETIIFFTHIEKQEKGIKLK